MESFDARIKFAEGDNFGSGSSGGSGGGERSGGGSPRDIGQKIVGDIFKKAVNIGAATMERAENTVNKTLALNPANFSKDMIKEVLESFFENYTIQINAEIKLNPRKKDDKKE